LEKKGIRPKHLKRLRSFWHSSLLNFVYFRGFLEENQVRHALLRMPFFLYPYHAGERTTAAVALFVWHGDSHVFDAVLLGNHDHNLRL